MFNEELLVSMSTVSVTGSDEKISATTHTSTKYVFSGNGRFGHLPTGTYTFENCIFESAEGYSAYSTFLGDVSTSNVNFVFINCQFNMDVSNDNFIYVQGSNSITFTDCDFQRMIYRGTETKYSLIRNYNSYTTLTITGTDLSGATSGNSTYGLFTSSSASTITITNSILPQNEKLVPGSGTLYLNGNNTIKGDVRVGTLNLGTDSVLRFENENKITITGTISGTKNFEFGGSAQVDFYSNTSVTNDQVTIVAPLAGEVGNSRTIATKLTGIDTSKTIKYGSDVVSINTSDSPVSYSSNTLSAAINFKLMAEGEASTVTFIASSCSDTFGTAVLGSDKTVTGRGAGLTGLNGTLYADGHTLNMSNLEYTGRIYGGNEIDTDTAESNTNNVTLNNVAAASNFRINGAGRITGDGLGVSDTSTTLNINLSNTSATKAGNIFAGAAVSGNSNYTVGSVSTTISGGYFGKFVGNGSQANSGNLNQGASSLTISGGSFDSYVYAGGYSQGSGTSTLSTAKVTGDVTLDVSGGTFSSYLFGGCAGLYNYAASHNTEVIGDITVTISGGTFIGNNAIFAGSQADGVVTGNTKVLFTDLTNVSFNGCTAGYGRIYGGSQNERDYANIENPNYKKCVSGRRTLEFSGSIGTVQAKFFNFDTVTFSNGASVIWDQASDMHLVDTWNFDASDDLIDLTWNNVSAENSFAGDTINVSGWTSGTKTLVATTNQSLLSGYDKATLTGATGAKLQVIEESGVYKLQIANA